MRGATIVIACLLALPHSLTGQAAPVGSHEDATTLPADARFEVLQPRSKPMWTFRLDRVTGNIDRLVPAKSGDWGWQKMRVLPHPKAVNTIKLHFQIVALDSPAQLVLLVDNESGATWQLVANGENGVWQPIE